MTDNYKVKVNIEIVKCGDAVTDKVLQAGAGKFERVISAEQGQSIDSCEQVLLQTTYAGLRDAFARHLSAVSEQYALELLRNKWF